MNKNVINELITDRADSNTYYNVSDLNRVETAVSAIAEFMNLIGYTVVVKKRPAEWVITDFPTDVEMSRYLNNLVNIRNQLNKKNLRLPNTMKMLTYEDANDIERLLKEANEVITNITSIYRRTGVTICGEGQFIDVADLSPYLDIFGVLTWRTSAPVFEDGILDLEYAVFNNGVFEDL